jgi:hypothetical protein
MPPLGICRYLRIRRQKSSGINNYSVSLALPELWRSRFHYPVEVHTQTRVEALHLPVSSTQDGVATIASVRSLW